VKSDQYQKAADRFQLPLQEIQALVEFRSSREFLVVRAFLEEFLRQETDILENSDEIEEILRAQGAKRIVKKLFNRIDEIMEEVKEK
jgi:hypothetical protein